MNQIPYVSIITTISLILSFLPLLSLAQDYGDVARKRWLDQAEANKPVLNERLIKPVKLGILKKDTNAFQGWKVEPSVAVDSLYQQGFKSQSGVIVDFGEHFTGYVSFSLAAWGRTPDAPFRLKFTFGEVPSELAVPFEPYSGSLSRAWLQDEIVTVSEVPSTLAIPRRLAFRYVKVELLSPSIGYDFKLTDLQIRATTSAKENVAPLLPETSPLAKEIDRVGLRTLRECMQTVYEDGPKRDRRLWIGDLYLEALASDLSFKNHSLTKRCLYLLAALSRTPVYFIRKYPEIFQE